MRKAKVIRIVCDILIVIFSLGFVLSLLWYMNGSLEVVPTEEQEAKAQIGAVLLMIVTGVPCIACVATRIKYKKG